MISGERMEGKGSAKIPKKWRDTVRRLKEILEDKCCEKEIYDMLEECGMDPGDALQKLLDQGTFQKVKSKRERRKEIKEKKESRDQFTPSEKANAYTVSQVSSSFTSKAEGSSTTQRIQSRLVKVAEGDGGSLHPSDNLHPDIGSNESVRHNLDPEQASLAAANLQQATLSKQLPVPLKDYGHAAVIPDHLKAPVDFSHLNSGMFRSGRGLSYSSALASNFPRDGLMVGSIMAANRSLVGHVSNREPEFHEREQHAYDFNHRRVDENTETQNLPPSSTYGYRDEFPAVNLDFLSEDSGQPDSSLHLFSTGMDLQSWTSPTFQLTSQTWTGAIVSTLSALPEHLRGSPNPQPSLALESKVGVIARPSRSQGHSYMPSSVPQASQGGSGPFQSSAAVDASMGVRWFDLWGGPTNLSIPYNDLGGQNQGRQLMSYSSALFNTVQGQNQQELQAQQELQPASQYSYQSGIRQDHQSAAAAPK